VSEPDSLDHLCEALGILPRYREHTGTVRQVPEATLRALVQRLGDRRAQGILPPVVVHRMGRGDIVVPIQSRSGPLRWTLAGEDGGQAAEGVDPAADRIVVPGTLTPGRYTLRLHDGDAVAASCPLIVTPARAFLPALLRDGARLWGLATQLFALRSPRNWGIGDFTDLGDLAEGAAANGVSAIGLTPLHALFPDQADRCSPYSPNSRCFLNVLYIDPEAMPEFATSGAAQELRREPVFAAELERLRSEPLVD
jgi:hypothetical protein